MESPYKGKTGLRRVWNALHYSIAGLKAAYTHEDAFRQEVWLAVFLIPAAFVVGQSWIETTLLAGSVALVVIVELLNSAVEATVDRVSFEWHDLAKRAKDYGSAAVLLSLILASAIWAAALWHFVRS